MINKAEKIDSRWDEYHALAAESPTREFLQQTLQRFHAPGFAIDLGCGTGSDTFFILNQGWDVLAVDQHEGAIRKLKTGIPSAKANNLITLVSSFEVMKLPSADFVWASYGLPFCHPSYFETMWQSICAALVPGGRFAGDFYGVRHAWSNNSNMTFHTKEQVLALSDNLHLEYIIEEEGEQQTTLDGVQHWHMFTICARKP